MPELPSPADLSPREQFDAILAKMWDDQLDETDAQLLGVLLQQHSEFRQEYLEAKHLLMGLHTICRSWHWQPLAQQIAPQQAPIEPPIEPSVDRNRPVYRAGRWLLESHRLGTIAATVAATVLVGLLVVRPISSLFDSGPANQPDESIAASRVKPTTVATVVDAVSTDIVEMLPVFAGRELSVGQVIELDAGITELRFRCGANAVLAGPARMSIEGPKQVRLDLGRLTVEMDEGVDGFEVFTRDGKVTDLGTSFGVSVANHDKSQVAVFEGVVELQSQRASDAPARLLAGQAMRFGRGFASELLADKGVLQGLQNVSLRMPDSVVVADKDAYVRGRDNDKHYEIQNFGRAPELLVKYESAATQSNRRAWISFDLSNLSRQALIGARLRLTVLPNQLAEQFALSKNHDYSESDTIWEFEVAGLWDELFDDWSEDQITWNNAPGNAPQRFSGRLVGPQAPVKLGTFSIHAGGRRGEQVVLAGADLLEFLKQDRDGRVTLIISRRTPCIHNSGEDVVVHGFASREHGELPGPALELWSEQQRKRVAVSPPDSQHEAATHERP